MVIFSMIATVDRILGNRFKLGREFERGFMIMGSLSLSMIGIIVISPLIAELLRPGLDAIHRVLHIDPSIIPASLFANDMGGATLAMEVTKNDEIGMFNGLVISSMMGCAISFTIPYALGTVEPKHQKSVLLGFLCGIATVPVGSFAAGLAAGISVLPLLFNLLPLIILSGIIAVGLIFCPTVCIKVFDVIGAVIKIIIAIGLALGILRYLTGIEIIKGLDTLENGAAICLNACAVMSGAFPLMFVVSKVLAKPLKAAGGKLGINETSALGFVSSLATCMTTFEMMRKMDEKGIVMNAAFALSGTSTFAGHLAFTLAYNPDYLLPVIVGKFISACAALLVAALVCSRKADLVAAEEKPGAEAAETES